MEPEGYFRTFGKRWFAIVLCTILGLLVSAGIAKAITPVYAASATLFLKIEQPGASLFEKSQFGLARIQTYPALVSSPSLLANVISALHLSMTQQQLSSDLTAVNPTSTVLLQVTATAPDPHTAADIANTAAAELSSLVNKLENTSTSASASSVRLNLTLPAEPPTVPSAPKVPIILGLGLIAGLALGLITALLLARFDTRLKTPADVRRYANLPVIGQLPPRLSRDWLTTNTDSQSSDAVGSALNETSANLRAIFGGTFPSLLALVPIGQGPSKPGTRVGLARSLAHTGRRVVLVETSETAQNVSGLLVHGDSVGLADVLSGAANLRGSVLRREGQPFDILPAGRPLESRASYAAERRARDAFGAITDQFDVAVVQVAQGGAPIDLDVIAPALTTAVLVATFARTNSHQLNSQIARIRALGIEPVGVIMTDVPQWRRAQLLESWLPSDIVAVTAERGSAPLAESVLPNEGGTVEGGRFEGGRVEDGPDTDGADTNAADVVLPEPVPAFGRRAGQSSARQSSAGQGGERPSTTHGDLGSAQEPELAE